MKDTRCKLCRSENVTALCHITSKPDVEVDYNIPKEDYSRKVYQCNQCSVYFNVHNLLDLESFYQGDYNASIDKNGLQKRFQRIISLPEKSSDNVNRVKRICEFLGNQYDDISALHVLDIGSGTCVFLHEIKKQIKHVYCIDPDQSAVDHALTTVGVKEGHQGTIFDYPSQKKFDLITFNKVLEHVENPIENLKKASQFLSERGFIYIELPEGDKIAEKNWYDQRAEFAIEHMTVFNSQSIEYLANQAGFDVISQDSIIDPSGKFTIYAYLEPKRTI